MNNREIKVPFCAHCERWFPILFFLFFEVVGVFRENTREVGSRRDEHLKEKPTPPFFSQPFLRNKKQNRFDFERSVEKSFLPYCWIDMTFKITLGRGLEIIWKICLNGLNLLSVFLCQFSKSFLVPRKRHRLHFLPVRLPPSTFKEAPPPFLYLHAKGQKRKGLPKVWKGKSCCRCCCARFFWWHDIPLLSLKEDFAA